MQNLCKPQSPQFFPARRSFYLLFGHVIVLRITMAHGSGTLSSLLPVILCAPSLSYKPSAEDVHAEYDETRGNPLSVLGAGSRALHACVARNGHAAPGGTDAFHERYRYVAQSLRFRVLQIISGRRRDLSLLVKRPSSRDFLFQPFQAAPFLFSSEVFKDLASEKTALTHLLLHATSRW